MQQVCYHELIGFLILFRSFTLNRSPFFFNIKSLLGNKIHAYPVQVCELPEYCSNLLNEAMRLDDEVRSSKCLKQTVEGLPPNSQRLKIY